MRFRYSTSDPSQDQIESLARVPLVLRNANRVLEVVGLIDSGATANVLPYGAGLQLGAVWDDRKASIRLTGSVGNRVAMPFLAMAEISGLPPVRLAFAWVNGDDVPLILGQVNFFMEFNVFFYRSKLEFEVEPRLPA